MPKLKKQRALPRAKQVTLRTLLASIGEVRTSELLDVSRATCLRGALGLPQSRAIIAAITLGLERYHEQGL